MSCFQFTPKDQSLPMLQWLLPRGVAWYAFRVPGKNAYKLFAAFAQGFEDVVEWMCKLPIELNPYSTDELITEWETAVGLPDACLPSADTLEARRRNVIFRLDKRRWSTAQDWHDLAALFGLTVTITPGWHVQRPALYQFCYPKTYINLPRLGRFHVYIDVADGCGGGGYTYDYPHSYGITQRCDDFICLIERVKPANVVVVWNNTPPIAC